MQRTSELGITRRAGMGLVLGGLAAAATSARAAGAIEQPKLDIGGNRDPQLGAQITIAVAKDYFKAEGLDVTVRWTDTGGDLLPLFAGGAINVGGLSLSSIAALNARGVPVKGVCALCDFSGTQGLVLRPGLKLSNPKELAGLKLAAPPSNPHEMALALLGKRYGFDSKSIKIVYMQPSEAIVAASRGDVDGALTFQPHLSRLVQMGGTLYFTGTATYFDGKETMLPTEDRLLFVHTMMLANQTWLASNPNTMMAIIRAIIRANDMIVNDRPQAETILSKAFHTDIGTMHESMNENTYGIAMDDALMRSFAFTSNWMQSIGQIKAPMDPVASVDTSFLKQINPGLVTFKA